MDEEETENGADGPGEMRDGETGPGLKEERARRRGRERGGEEGQKQEGGSGPQRAG